MRQIKIILISILLIIPCSIFANSAVDIVIKAEKAESNVCYRGIKQAIVNVNNKSHISMFKITHSKPDNTRIDYHSPSIMNGMIVIQKNNNEWLYRPSERAWEYTPYSSRTNTKEILNQALKNFKLEIIGNGRIADRDAVIIKATPLQNTENLRKVWIDKEYYLVLKTVVEDDNGKPLRAVYFKEIEFNPTNISKSAFKVDGIVKVYKKPAKIDFNVSRPTYLPAGYKEIDFRANKINNHTCVHILYSNGASVISLFQRKSSNSIPQRQFRAITINNHSWDRNGISYTLIGEVSNSELLKIASSIK
ncbi:MAG: sigma-E factor regulatory protein RseB domain-containing protein [Armatimonadota bacterium]